MKNKVLKTSMSIAGHMHEVYFIVCYTIGTCITTASPDGVCHLDAVATECADFDATVCTCGAGYCSEGLLCTGMR